MSRHGENIYYRKDGRYEGRYVIGKTPNGKTAFGYVYGKKYKDVKNKLMIIKAKMAKKHLYSNIKHNKTVSEWIWIWLDNYMKDSIKDSTYSIYRGQMEKYVIPLIGNYYLANIDRETLFYLYNEILKKGRTKNTAQNICKRFMSSLNYAVEENYLQSLPPLPFKTSTIVKKAPRYLSETEQESLETSLNLIKKKDLAIYLSLYSGIRIGECCALKWKDVNLKEGYIDIIYTLQRIRVYDQNIKTYLNYGEVKTKNSICKIPLIHNLCTKLYELKKITKPIEEDFVFGDKSRPLEPRTLQAYITLTGENLNIQNMHFHTLRHTFATRCIEQQIDIKSISELLGHSSVKNTLDWYCHSSNEQKKRMIKKLEK